MTSSRSAGLLVMAGSWGFLDGFFTAPRPLMGIAGLAAGACLWILGAGPGGRKEALWQSLSIVALQGALMIPLPLLLAHGHDLSGVSSLVAVLLRGAGLPAGTDAAGRLLVDAGTGTIAVAVSCEMLALPVILRLAAAVLLIPRCAGRGAAAIAAGAAGRVMVLLAAMAAGMRVAVLYEPAVSLASFALFAAVPLAPSGHPCFLPRAGRPAWRGVPVVATAALGAAGVLAGMAVAWHPPGAERAGGEILIDESRSNWEWTTIPFDDRLYGQRSLYNYALWRAWIEAHHPTRVVHESLTDADLASASVLIVKTPTSPYDEAGVRRIERFVRRGGGLWLIGDHTNLFGMSAVLNRLAAPYGVEFLYDDLFPLDHEADDRFVPPRIAAHPVLRGIPFYPFETSCSLRVPWSVEHIMLGRALGSEDVDYGHVNFFGDIRLQASERFGVFTQAAAIRHGRGRVVAFTDSTNFSNFSMLWPGRRAFVANTLDWLWREPPRAAETLRATLWAAAFAVAGAALWLGLPPGGGRPAALWACLALQIAASSATAASLRPPAGSPRPSIPIRTIAFDTQWSRFVLAPGSPVLTRHAPTWDDYNAFFINAARTGWWPEVDVDLSDALAHRDAVVLVRPRRPPDPRRARELAAFLKRGGRLMVIDSAIEPDSASAPWVVPYGLMVERAMQPLRGEPTAMVPGLEVAAGEGAQRRVTTGGAVLAWRDVGAGRIVLMSDGALFSDRAVGGVYAVVGPAARSSHAAQAEALRLLLEPRRGAE